MPILTNSENWTLAPGVGGFPQFTHTRIGTHDTTTLRDIERDGYRLEYLKFTRLPYTEQLVVASLLGTPLTLTTIQPPGYDYAIPGTVKICPPTYQLIAPVGGSLDYPTYQIVRYITRYQLLTHSRLPGGA